MLFDTGATISLITFKAAKKLGLPKGARKKLTVVKVGGVTDEIISVTYSLPLLDKNNKITYVQVYGIEKISSNIGKADIGSVLKLFPEVKSEDILVPGEEINVLLGMNYASMHPQRERSIGNMSVYSNQFGKCFAGSHNILNGEEGSIVNNVYVLHVKAPTVKDFFQCEEMGVRCYPECGGCKCGKCPIGGKEFTIKEERELALIEAGLKHKENYWEAIYPWIKDPHMLPDNRLVVSKMMQSTETRLLKDPEKGKIYDEQIKDMVQRGVAKKLSQREILHQ